MGQATLDAMHERFGTEAKDVIAAVGPSICQECYEVSGDVIEEFRAAFPETLHEKLFYGKPDGKYQLNLWEANHQILLAAGVPEKQIHLPNLCTCCNPDFLYSHRASTGKKEETSRHSFPWSENRIESIKNGPGKNRSVFCCMRIRRTQNRLSVFCQQLIDFLCRRLYFCNGYVVVKRIDDACHIFAHLSRLIPRTGNEFRCTVGQVGGDDFADIAFLIVSIEFLQTIGEEAEGGADKDVVSAALFDLFCNVEHTLRRRSYRR